MKLLFTEEKAPVNQINFLAVCKHSVKKVDGVLIDDYVDSTKAKYKSVMTLINRRNAIKRAIILSNATTKVTIGGKEYTVAEAIDMKANGMYYMRDILGKIEGQWTRAQATAERENGEKLDARADAYVKSLYEGSDMKNLSKELQELRENFVASQMVDIIDPIDIQKEMQTIRDHIDSFTTEVDSALSVSNALTTVDVEYETM